MENIWSIIFNVYTIIFSVPKYTSKPINIIICLVSDILWLNVSSELRASLTGRSMDLKFGGKLQVSIIKTHFQIQADQLRVHNLFWVNFFTMINLHLRIRIKCQMSNRDLYWLFLCIHFVEASTENFNQICSPPMIGECRLPHDMYRYILYILYTILLQGCGRSRTSMFAS